jgi:hypothetical protein
MQLPSVSRHGQILETTQSVQRPGDVEKITDASLILFSSFGTPGKILAQKTLSLNVAAPITNFAPLAIKSSGGVATLDPDKNYEVANTVLGYNAAYDKPYGVQGMDQIPSSTVWGFNGTVPVAAINGAQRGDFAYTDFEYAQPDEFQVSNAFYATPRSGGSGMHPYATLQKTITRQADTYYLTYWIKSTATVPLRVTIKNTTLSTTYFDQTFSVPAAAEFTYMRHPIPVGNAPSTFIVQIQGQGLSQPSGSSASLLPALDDVSFYPEHATVNVYGYTFPYGISALTDDRGSAVYTSYDGLGRKTYTYDQDRNIRGRNAFTYAKPLYNITAAFSAPTTGYRNEVTTFTAAGNACIQGETYEWDFGTGTYVSGSETANYTFTVDGTYIIRLRVTHPAYGQVVQTRTVQVMLRPINLEVCANGIVDWYCGEGRVSVNLCPDVAMPAQGVILVGTIQGETISGVTYVWKRKDINSNTWTTVGTNSSQYTVPFVSPNSVSFTVRCEVTSPTGRFGSQSFLINATPCE